MIRLTKLAIGVLSAVISVSPVAVEAAPQQVSTSVLDFVIIRQDDGSCIGEWTGPGADSRVALTYDKARNISGLAFFNRGYQLTLGKVEPYQIRFEGWKTVNVQSTTMAYKNQPGIIFTFPGMGAFDVAEHTVTILKDGKAVRRDNYPFAFHRVIDDITKCASESGNPFAN